MRRALALPPWLFSLDLWVWPISVVVAWPRFRGVHGEAYQACAHLWVGFLAGLYVGYHRQRMRHQAAVTLALFVGLGLVEIACFLRFGPQP